MNAAAATVSDRAAQPDTTRAGARAFATLNAFAALVMLVFDLIEHGKTLAVTLRDHIRGLGHARAGRFFGTGNAHAIGTYMRRGVMRSIALHKMLLWHQANRPLGSRLAGLRHDRIPPEQGSANARGDAAAQDNAPAKPMRSEWRQTGDLSSLTTDQAITDAARRHAAGAMRSDMCRRSSMTGENPGALRHESLVPTEPFGGSLTQFGDYWLGGSCRQADSRPQFSAEVDRRKAPASRIETPRFEAPPEHQRPNCLSAEEQLRVFLPPQAASAECPSPEAEPRSASRHAFERTETAPAMHWPVSPRPAREVAATAQP